MEFFASAGTTGVSIPLRFDLNRRQLRSKRAGRVSIPLRFDLNETRLQALWKKRGFHPATVRFEFTPISSSRSSRFHPATVRFELGDVAEGEVFGMVSIPLRFDLNYT